MKHLGQLLVSEGFGSIEDIAQSSAEDISKIDGIDLDTAKELNDRSKDYLEKEKADVEKKLKDLGVEDSLMSLKGLTPGMLVTLGENNIKKLEEFADLASDELTGAYDEIKGERIKINGLLEDFALSKNEADDLIMKAREIAYK